MMNNATQQARLTGAQLKRAIFAWCLYDWGCSSFSSIVVTFIFATYFTTKIAINPIVGTFQWANAMSLAGIIIAVSSPLFGAIADYGGHHKKWLFFFTAIAVIFSGLLWFAYPTPQAIFFTLTVVVIGSVGYETAQVFYNSYLPEFAPKAYLGRISGWGWGCGYLGGICSLSIALYFFIKAPAGTFDTSTAEQVRICGPFVGLWYGLFALPLFIMVPTITKVAKPLPMAIKAGIRKLTQTLKSLPKDKNMMLYLIAHMFYTDGLNTLFAFGGIYAAGTFGLSFEEVLLFGITMNITAGIGAIALASLDDHLGSKETILLSLLFLVLLGIPILVLQQKYIFWGMALLLGLFVGPVQSASRSLMVRLILHKESTAEMFGLYALSGKITAFLGPWVLGTITLMTNSQRLGMATILCFFVIGALLLFWVRVPVAISQATTEIN